MFGNGSRSRKLLSRYSTTYVVDKKDKKCASCLLEYAFIFFRYIMSLYDSTLLH